MPIPLISLCIYRTLGEEGRRRITREGLTWESMAKKIQGILASEVKNKHLC